MVSWEARCSNTIKLFWFCYRISFYLFEDWRCVYNCREIYIVKMIFSFLRPRQDWPLTLCYKVLLHLSSRFTIIITPPKIPPPPQPPPRHKKKKCLPVLYEHLLKWFFWCAWNIEILSVVAIAQQQYLQKPAQPFYQYIFIWIIISSTSTLL